MEPTPEGNVVVGQCEGIEAEGNIVVSPDRLTALVGVRDLVVVQSDRVTLCISSQVGCALDCDFCLTGKMGFRRHLTPGEIAGQVAAVNFFVSLLLWKIKKN